MCYGKGFSKFAMHEIIKIAKEELGLDEVYWYVNPENFRAIKFYDKNGYKRFNPKECLFNNYIWYRE